MKVTLYNPERPLMPVARLIFNTADIIDLICPDPAPKEYHMVRPTHWKGGQALEPHTVSVQDEPQEFSKIILNLDLDVSYITPARRRVLVYLERDPYTYPPVNILKSPLRQSEV
jgi:hypothetical protein